jgi:RNA-directed DNA polymerase
MAKSRRTTSRQASLFDGKSDRFIVVRRAGNADGAKGPTRAGSCHRYPPVRSDGETGQKEVSIPSDGLLNRWARISERAQNKNAVFTNLLTHINGDSLREAYKAIDGKKAWGVDKLSKVEYGKNLEENLQGLMDKIHKGTYRPQPKREVLIPKMNGKTRPIAIACFEDKLVDWVIGKILTQVFEPLFIRNSFGYRPHKSAHGAIEACYYSLCKNERKYVVEIDFSNFFNTIPHRKMMTIVKRRIKDSRFTGLIGRFLKGELISQEGDKFPSVLGTPQGSIMSPILANIYLNEVLDQWFMQNYASYRRVIVRYADDAIFFFTEENEAKQFLTDLEQRVQAYGLRLNPDKTHLLALPKSGHYQFNFLGFTFYWGKQQKKILLKVKTQKEKLIQGIREFYHWIKQVRNKMTLDNIWRLARSKIRGHNNYYGYWMNGLKLNHFHWEATKSLFKWLNRRSQKRSYTWEGFKERLKNFPLMDPLDTMKLKPLGWNPYA